jgi:hypothetical protein
MDSVRYDKDGKKGGESNSRLSDSPSFVEETSFELGKEQFDSL